MLAFNVPSISCGRCVRAITETAHHVDPQAKVQVDIANKMVRVETSADRELLVSALTEAGYRPL